MKRPAVLPFLILPLLLAGGSARAQTVTLRADAYRELVGACRRAVEKAPSPETAEPLSRRLRAVRRVIYPDGQRVAVNNAELARLLADAPRSKPAHAGARARLQTLDALLRPPRTKPGLAEDPRGQAAAILAGAEFRRAAALEAENKPKNKSWWERWMEKIGKSIEDFLENLFSGGPGSGAGAGILSRAFLFVFYFLGGVALLVGVYLIVKATRAGWPNRRRRARAGGEFADGAGDDALPDPLGAARDRARAGDYRAALRLTYLACLRRLQGAGLLVLDGDKTNWEYQRTLRARSPDAHDTLLPVTRDFDRVWYGQMPATPDEFERALRAHDALPEAAEETRETAGTAPTGGPGGSAR